jgi:hypothetical protein
LLDQVEVFDCACAAGVRNWDVTPLGKFADEVDVDAGLEAFVVRGMDEELGTVRF